jgi:hypothetical protein
MVEVTAGTQLPNGFQIRNDTTLDWLIEPARSMMVEEFGRLLFQITVWQPVF